jgi:hypothetical protein
MTKKAATLSTDVQAPAQPTIPAAAEAAPAIEMTPASVTLMPPTIRLFGPTLLVLEEAVVHSRLGFHIDLNAPVDQYVEAGTMSLFMKLGTPDAGIVKIAAATIDAATSAQRFQYAQDVKAAARRMIVEDARAAREAEVAAKIVEAKAQVAAIEAAARADIEAMEVTMYG